MPSLRPQKAPFLESGMPIEVRSNLLFGFPLRSPIESKTTAVVCKGSAILNLVLLAPQLSIVTLLSPLIRFYYGMGRATIYQCTSYCQLTMILFCPEIFLTDGSVILTMLPVYTEDPCLVCHLLSLKSIAVQWSGQLAPPIPTYKGHTRTNSKIHTSIPIAILLLIHDEV